MQVFVTGATGFVGSAVCRALREEGHEVAGLTSRRQKASLLEERGITPVVGDMRDSTVLGPQAERAEVSILCAQLGISGRFTRRRLVEFAEAEMLSSRAIADAAAKRGRRVIYTAGYLMFGVGADGWTDESHGFDPPAFSEGGVAASEYVLGRVAARKITGCVIAPGFVYGPAGFFAEVTGMIRDRKFRMPGGGNYYWSPVHIDDLAAAYVKALDGAADGKAVLVVDDAPMLMRDIMGTIAAALGVKPPGAAPKFLAKLFIGGAMVDGITTSRRCRNGLARELLGWSPRWPTFADGLPAVIRQLEAQRA